MLSQDVVFLNKNYCEWVDQGKISEPTVTATEYNTDNEEQEILPADEPMAIKQQK